MTARSALRSGWIPFALVVVVALGVIHRGTHVPVTDLLTFAGYVAGWLTLPGTLAWRWATRTRGPRPLAEDLAIGTLVGYVLEFPAYLLCLAAGAPRAYLAWPVVVVLATLALPGGRRLWRRSRQTMPLAWSWIVAGFTLYVVGWFAHNIWGPEPITDAALRRPYVDEPFHLSLAAGLMHHFPPSVLYVDDTPLKYHWLSHLNVAASATVTGLEPVVLLRTLAVPVLMIVCAVAAAHVAVRLTGARWTGPVLMAGLLVTPAIYTGWSDGNGEPLLSTRLVHSPSAGFVNAALLVGVLLCIELLRRNLSGVAPWLLTGLTFLAMLGAKSTSLPTLMAGLALAAVVASLVHRRIDRVAAGLGLLSLVVFVVGTPFFFGTDSHGMKVDVLALAVGHTGLPNSVRPLMAVYFLGYLSTALGLLALLLRQGWREPDRVFLVTTCLAGIGAGFVFHQQALSEYYFLYVVLLPMLLGGVLGLHALSAGQPARRVLAPGLTAFGAAVVAGLVLIKVDQAAPVELSHGSAARRALEFAVLPTVTVLVIAVVLALLVRWLFRARSDGAADRAQGTALTAILLVLTLAGLGAAPTLWRLPDWARDPWRTDIYATRPELIGPGGITAARWLRDHTGADTLVATNAHCEFRRQHPCYARNFWMAAYSERQFLVEGWSYQSWSAVGKESPLPDNTITGPFWDPVRLAENDAAFKEPSAATLDRLKARGVRWLLVDRRFPVKPRELARYAETRKRIGAYSIFELR